MSTHPEDRQPAISAEPSLPCETIKSMSIDFERGTVALDRGQGEQKFQLHEPEAFQAMSEAWLRANWEAKYVYTFTWMGRPIIQLPDDTFRLQELIYSVKPDIILETGVAHGGSLMFYASLCKAMGKGCVIGVDVEIRPHNRRAIEEHELYPLIRLVEGDSADSATIELIKSMIQPEQTVFVILDSCHTKDHVLRELTAYSPLVSMGSYIVAMDGIMHFLGGASRTTPDWDWNNPRSAALEFVAGNPSFAIQKPSFKFNEGFVTSYPTYAPDGIIKRIS